MWNTNDQMVLPAGNYQLDVVAPNGGGAAAVPFGLAWTTVPEPTTLALLVLALPAMLMAARRGKLPRRSN